MKNKLFTLSFVALCLCSCSSSKKPIEDGFKIVLNEVQDEVNLHTELQQQYIDCGFSETVRSYASGIAEFSKPEYLNLTYTTSSEVAGPYYLEISKTRSFSSKKVIENDEPSFYVSNLEVRSTYYWRGYVVNNGKTIYSDISSFQTSDTIIRNLDVDGVTNVRDIGGYEVFGKYSGYVKQGLIYRCGRLNVSSASSYLRQITQLGIETMLNDLNIKSEIDLRRTDNNEVGGAVESPLGKDVNYYSCPMTYEGNLVTSNTESIANIFHLFADEKNYPLCFHCNIGTDRTGAIAYLLLGYLGVDIYDINYDYLFSNFGNIGGSRSIGNDVVSYRNSVNKYDTSSLQGACESYLLSIGISEAELASIASLMIE